ncbi:DNA mismatch repair protein MutL [Testicularia cyperi]|uniref:DNA mismatch repair protein MutL n=1 Tax=Testicularia cyperi TaxID=1882483 RepID=A0A317XJV0_9BASI|nr:DNA mismatch repair protein MutL [Testicularia cyperi]DBA11361.1 TPA_inf: PMS1 [Testicularia cyperi]
MSADDDVTGSIRPIASADVHRITSGQVVLDLQTAVKELVENALDAGATNIAIHFRDYGADSFEVVDNGSGIDPSNYQTVALKHYTSKLSSFSDLAMVRTFGFRGEALSSLCALAQVSVHTATKDDAPMGTILDLDNRGNVRDASKRAARQRGTTVSITGLFRSLPVRRKEFEKNLKREYTKAQNLLQAYALITRGVRWSTTNAPKNTGRKTPQFSVNSSAAANYLLGNVSALFGAKVGPTLMPLELKLTFSTGRRRPGGNPAKASTILQDADEDCNDDDDNATLDDTSTVTVTGLISKPTYGSGRASSDRQFFYINGRPWEAGRVSRAFNEVYKSFNSQQLPFVVADFRLPTDSYDVNVSPDKRTIFLHDESRLVEKVKEGLEAFFAPSRGTFIVNGASLSLRSAGGAASTTTTTTTANVVGHQARLSRFGLGASSTNEPETMDEDVDENRVDETLDHEAERSIDLDAETESCDTEQQLDESDNRGTRSSRSRHTDLEYREDGSDDDERADATISTQDVITSQMEEGDTSEPDELVPVVDGDVSASLRAVPEKRLAEDEEQVEVLDTTQASWSPSKRAKSSSSCSLVVTVDASSIPRPIPSGPRLTFSGLKAYAMPGSELASSIHSGIRHNQTHGNTLGDEEVSNNNLNIDNADEDLVSELVATPMKLGRDDEELEISDQDRDEQDRRQNLERLTQQGEEADADGNGDELIGSSTARDGVEDGETIGIGSIRDEDADEYQPVMSFSLSSLRERLQSRARAAARRARSAAAAQNKLASTTTAEKQLMADAGIDSRDEASVEQALSRVIHKQDFASMEVIGQFNLGFIIARRRRQRQGQPSRSLRTLGENLDGNGNGSGNDKVGLDSSHAPAHDHDHDFEVEEQDSMDDLFIVDQHASDEKYNFETLQSTTVIRSQRLIVPRRLELSASDELVAIEHRSTLLANGFEIRLDDDDDDIVDVDVDLDPVHDEQNDQRQDHEFESEPESGQDRGRDAAASTPVERERKMPGNRLLLVSQPISKSIVFGVKDLEELIFALRDISPGSHAARSVRCSKARHMFASRACRKSVMIGTALDKRQMKAILKNMGTIEQPWNCPHGRPTMRHLACLKLLDLDGTLRRKDLPSYRDQDRSSDAWA